MNTNPSVLTYVSKRETNAIWNPFWEKYKMSRKDIILSFMKPLQSNILLLHFYFTLTPKYCSMAFLLIILCNFCKSKTWNNNIHKYKDVFLDNHNMHIKYNRWSLSTYTQNFPWPLLFATLLSVKYAMEIWVSMVWKISWMFMENLPISNSELCAYLRLLEKLQLKIYLLTLGLEFPKLIWLWQSLWPRFLWRLREQWFGSKLQNLTTVACILDRMFVIPSIHMLVETSTLNKIIFDKKTSRNNKAFIRLWTWGYDGKICVLIIKGTA